MAAKTIKRIKIFFIAEEVELGPKPCVKNVLGHKSFEIKPTVNSDQTILQVVENLDTDHFNETLTNAWFELIEAIKLKEESNDKDEE